MKRSKTKKKEIKKNELRIKEYIYPSIIMGLALTGFNFCLLIFSLYSEEYTGVFFSLFNNLIVDTIINIIFDVIFFGGVFLIDIYLLIEVIILNRHN